VTTKTLFPYNGPTRITLSYAAMRRDQEFINTDVYGCFYNKFRKPSEVTSCLNVLEKHDLVARKNDGWIITDLGRDYLKNSCKQYYGRWDD